MRVENGLAVLDMDIDDEIIGEIANELQEAHPRLAQALIRFGKGHKEAWFIRLTAASRSACCTAVLPRLSFYATRWAATA